MKFFTIIVNPSCTDCSVIMILKRVVANMISIKNIITATFTILDNVSFSLNLTNSWYLSWLLTNTEPSALSTDLLISKGEFSFFSMWYFSISRSSSTAALQLIFLFLSFKAKFDLVGLLSRWSLKSVTVIFDQARSSVLISKGNIMDSSAIPTEASKTTTQAVP